MTAQPATPPISQWDRLWEELPPELHQQVYDFAVFLKQRHETEREEAWFWGLIELLDWEREGDDDKVVEPIISHLAQETDEKIFLYQDIQAKKLYDLDTPDHYERIGHGADGSLYARAGIVANGRTFYQACLFHPENIPEDMPWFERLLYLAETAYERKHGKEMERIPTYIFETRWNQEAWGEDAITPESFRIITDDAE